MAEAPHADIFNDDMCEWDGSLGTIIFSEPDDEIDCDPNSLSSFSIIDLCFFSAMTQIVSFINKFTMSFILEKKIKKKKREVKTEKNSNALVSILFLFFAVVLNNQSTDEAEPFA